MDGYGCTPMAFVVVLSLNMVSWRVGDPCCSLVEKHSCNGLFYQPYHNCLRQAVDASVHAACDSHKLPLVDFKPLCVPPNSSPQHLTRHAAAQITLAARLAFDLMGKLWTIVICDGVTVFFLILALGGACNFRPGLLVAVSDACRAYRTAWRGFCKSLFAMPIATALAGESMRSSCEVAGSAAMARPPHTFSPGVVSVARGGNLIVATGSI